MVVVYAGWRKGEKGQPQQLAGNERRLHLVDGVHIAAPTEQPFEAVDQRAGEVAREEKVVLPEDRRMRCEVDERGDDSVSASWACRTVSVASVSGQPRRFLVRPPASMLVARSSDSCAV